MNIKVYVDVTARFNSEGDGENSKASPSSPR